VPSALFFLKAPLERRTRAKVGVLYSVSAAVASSAKAEANDILVVKNPLSSRPE